MIILRSLSFLGGKIEIDKSDRDRFRAKFPQEGYGDANFSFPRRSYLSNH
jgi:hypothetical protein